MKTIVVIPNHLPSLAFLQAWKEFNSPDISIIVIQDIGDKPTNHEGLDITIYDHKDIEKDLGKNAWIIPNHTSACRSYGYYKAWQEKPDIITTLDNDCLPERDDYFVKGHSDILNSKTTLDWFKTAPIFTRGYPYLIRDKSEIVLNHGLWSNIPDLDAPTSLQNPNLRFGASETTTTIPRNNFAIFCGMNLAWKTILTPAMYFGIFGPDYGFDQYDDVFSSIVVKKILDHLNYAVNSGYPSVRHNKQSNVFANLKKQAPGMEMNENFWKEVQKIELTKNTVTDCYEELINKLPDVIEGEVPGWTKKYKEACNIWVNLFK